MSKLLCCFGGGESEYDYVKDRGFWEYSIIFNKILFIRISYFNIEKS